MGTKNRWIGNANATTHTFTITLTGPATGVGAVTFKNGAFKSVSAAIANTDTAAAIANNLFNALNSSTIPEILEIAFSYPGSGAVITGTMTVSGIPAKPSASTTATGTTVVVADTVACTGPNWANNVSNWSLGQPTNAMDLIVDGGPDILYGIGGTDFTGFCASTPISLHIMGSFKPGSVGLGEFRAAIGAAAGGSTYFEFRDRFWKSGVPLIIIGEGDGGGPDLCNLDIPNGGELRQMATNGVVNLTATTGETPAQVSLFGGTMTWGYDPLGNTSCTITAFDITGGTFSAGPGNTITTVNLKGGAMETFSIVTTLNATGGVYVQSDGTLGTVVATGGKIYLNHKQATDITVQAQGSHGEDPPFVDCSANDLHRQLSNTSYFKGGSYLLDPNSSTNLSAVVFEIGESLSNSILGNTTVAITR